MTALKKTSYPAATEEAARSKTLKNQQHPAALTAIQKAKWQMRHPEGYRPTCIQTGRLHGSEDYRQTCFRAFSCVALTWNLYHFLHIYLQPSAWEKCKSLFPFLVFSFNVFLVLLPETAHWCTKLNKNVLASKTDFVAGEDYSKGKDHIQVIRATPPHQPKHLSRWPLTSHLWLPAHQFL